MGWTSYQLPKYQEDGIMTDMIGYNDNKAWPFEADDDDDPVTQLVYQCPRNENWSVIDASLVAISYQ